ncbi:Cytochrome P450 84A1 [Linum grandiflorum]
MIIILFLRHGRSSRLPLPPGPRGLPIIGNMLMMDQLTHHGLAKLAKQYGGLFHLRMGNIHMMTVSTSDIAKQVLKVHDNIFSNRPANIAINYLTYDRSDMAFAHYGPFWRQMRKITVMKLFSRRRAESWDSVRDEITIKLTKDNIKAIIMDVMFGGTETVASVIEWAMAELLKSPQDLKRVQQELTYVVGLNRHVEEKDLEKLTFLKCILKETLRLHPPIPLLLHETAEDVEVSGYFIPKRSRVMVNAFAIGRDPNSWSNPNEFNPSRFLNQGMPDFKGSNFEFLPFGSGRRSCPGMQLGLYAIELGMAHLLHDFNWELPYGMKPNEVDMTDVFGLTAPRATRLIAVPTSRLTC